MVTLYQDCSSNCDSSKNMAARGRGLFSLYIYIKNFKNLLLRNRLTKFNVTLYQDCSSLHDTSKNMVPRGWGLFSIYICIENFKILLVKYLLTDFNNALVTQYRTIMVLLFSLLVVRVTDLAGKRPYISHYFWIFC